jgi:hypothetical protein
MAKYQADPALKSIRLAEPGEQRDAGRDRATKRTTPAEASLFSAGVSHPAETHGAAPAAGVYEVVAGGELPTHAEEELHLTCPNSRHR